MRRVVFDLEGDGLLDTLTVIHCLVLKDLDTGELVSCTDNDPDKYHSIAFGLSLLSKAERIYGHNIIGYDLPALEQVLGWTYEGEVVDTQIVCQARWPHIREMDFELHRKDKIAPEHIGRHTLASWGYRLGIRKQEYDGGWEEWSPEMHHYCEQDVEVNACLVEHIKKVGLPAETVEVEHELRRYLVQQEQNGWAFDLQAAVALQGKLAGLRETVAGQLRSMIEPWYVPNGEVTPKRTQKRKDGQRVEGCPYTKIKPVEFNPGSRDHIANRLQTLYGWKPTTFTNSGKPKVDETVLEGLDWPEVHLIKKYLLLDKRLGQIAEGKEAWLGHATENPETGLFHIHHRCKQNHCITSRASHASPNLAQVPRVGSAYGEECRSLFIVPRGFVQVGADVSGLELRGLAHYMWRWDDGAYAELVLSDKPNDVHTRNATILGLSRDDAKAFIYALIYGAGDAKLGIIIEPGVGERKAKKIGREARAEFMRALPALAYLVKGVKLQFRKHGYIRLIDGRRAYPRAEHSALNTLIQGTGSVICKRWIIDFNRELCRVFNTPDGGGWSHEWAALGWIHDEVQLAVRQGSEAVVQEILIEAIRGVESHYNFRLPLDGEAKVGRNWAETH